MEGWRDKLPENKVSRLTMLRLVIDSALAEMVEAGEDEDDIKEFLDEALERAVEDG